MTIAESVLEEIKARIPCSSVVGRKVKLRKAGREWKGLSPFNAEKSPSFTVNDQKNFWHDFSSGRHGDIFSFLIETEGLTFPEAVERLAAEANVEIPKDTSHDRERDNKARSLHDTMALAASWFEAQLATPEAAHAREYLSRRGVQSHQQTFGVGYAPSRRYALRDFLAGRGVGIDDMLLADLIKNREHTPIPYETFRDRIIFPIQSVKGDVVGFGGRALQPTAKAKYLNTAETPIFHKGHMLYNLNRARGPAHDSGRLIVVEGYMDVIAMTMAGYAETVAPNGTAITEDQLGLMWRHAPEPIMLLDGDSAGQRAATRVIDLALPHLTAGKSLSFAALPPGADPDDLVRSGRHEQLKAVLSRARPLVDVLWDREFNGKPSNTPERRADLRSRLLGCAGRIQDRDVSHAYRDELESRFRSAFPSPFQKRQPQRATLSAEALAFMKMPEPDPIALAEEERMEEDDG